MKKLFFTLFFTGLMLISGLVTAAQSGKLTQNIQEMVNSSELIVTGKLGKVVSSGLFYGYQDNAEALAELDKLTPIPLALHYIDYELEVDQLLMEDADLVLSDNGMIIYRIIQSEPSENHTKDQKEYLFFLLKAPKGNVYGVKTAMHRLTLNDHLPVKLTLGNETFSPQFIEKDDKMSSNEFVSRVLEAVALKSNH